MAAAPEVSHEMQGDLMAVKDGEMTAHECMHHACQDCGPILDAPVSDNGMFRECMNGQAPGSAAAGACEAAHQERHEFMHEMTQEIPNGRLRRRVRRRLQPAPAARRRLQEENCFETKNGEKFCQVAEKDAEKSSEEEAGEAQEDAWAHLSYGERIVAERMMKNRIGGSTKNGKEFARRLQAATGQRRGLRAVGLRKRPARRLHARHAHRHIRKLLKSRRRAHR